MTCIVSLTQSIYQNEIDTFHPAFKKTLYRKRGGLPSAPKHRTQRNTLCGSSPSYRGLYHPVDGLSFRRDRVIGCRYGRWEGGISFPV